MPMKCGISSRISLFAKVTVLGFLVFKGLCVATCVVRALIPLLRKKKSVIYANFCRLRAKKGPAPPPSLGNFADISYLEENFKPHLLRDVCTLCSGALVSDSLLHMLL